MSWVLTILTLVMAGVVGMLLTMRRIQRAPTESARDLASVAFWAELGALGLLLLVAFAQPIARFGLFESEAGLVTVALMSIMPLVVSFVGLRNATLLAMAMRRRGRALGSGELVEARVVERSRRLLANDIMSVVLEADVPERLPGSELAYRQRDLDRTRCHRFVETCPTDHWARLEPGKTVSLRYDPTDLRSFAVVLAPSA
ncbi:MAG: hypothetical protein IAG13_16440 [Deltaproteobacteria bacterium]|nr:hypothetical protein [Nannocystaceae bacterium]